MMKRKLFSKTDLFLIMPLLIAAILAIFLPGLKKDGGARRAVVVYRGETVLEADIDTMTEPETHAFGSVTVEIGPEGARFISSPCPDQICVKTGLLTKSGDTAACVPERIVVKIVSGTDAVDAVAY